MAIGRLVCIQLELGNTIVAVVERALSLLVRVISEADDSEVRMLLTTLGDNVAVAPNLLSQQEDFTADSSHGQ